MKNSMFRNEHERSFLNDAIRGGRGTTGIKPHESIGMLLQPVDNLFPFIYSSFYRQLTVSSVSILGVFYDG